MSLEPLDRKSSSLRERKHQSSESLGSVARWRGSNPYHHRPREFNRAADYRRPAGHGRQGSWHLFPEESGHEHMLSRSCDRKLEEDNCRSSISRGDGKYGRGNKESREAFSQKEWRGRSWETTNNSLNMARRQTDVSNDRKSVDDMLTYSSHPNSDTVNNLERHHMKDHHDKMGGVNRFGTSQRCDRDGSLGMIDLKPLKWTRPGCLSSQDSGFSRSSSIRSLGGTNSKGSCEGKVGLLQKTATAVESNSGDAATCRTSSAPSEETNSRKKSRLNWGEGLAKFERKQVEVPEVTSHKDGPVSPPFNIEPSNFLRPSFVDKSPKISGLPGGSCPATPSSAACSSSPDADDKLLKKAANVDIGVGNFSSSPGPGSQSHGQMFSFNLEKEDIDSLISLGSSLLELLPQSDGLSSVDYSLLCSTTMTKLLILKADISKVLELTEAEIDLLENELRSLKSKSEGRIPCSAAVVCNAKSCDEQVEVSDKAARFESLQIVSSDDLTVEKRPIVEKVPLSANLLDLHDNFREDVHSPGPARFKFLEPLPMINGVSACDVERCSTFSEGLNGIQSKGIQCLIPCTNRHAANVSTCGDSNSSLDAKDAVDTKSSASFYSSTADILYDTIISCNKKTAKAACEVFANLLPEKCCKNDNIGTSSGSCSQNATFIMEKFAEKRRLARLKERVITLKFKALHYLWKEDMRLLSRRKRRPKSHKKLELDLRTTCNSHQKKRSSIPFRFPFPAGNQLRLVPTSEVIKYTSQLLLESKHEIHRSTLKMPALILDQKDKMNAMFLSSNGLVEDPVAIEKERTMINPWTSEEKEIFLEKFAAFGKDFRKIATFLDHKTTADCVEFYYKNHKSDCFEKIMKKDDDKLGKFFIAKTASGIKWNSEVNTSSLDILRAASVVADGIASNGRMRSRRSLWRGYGNKGISRGDNITTDRPDSFEDLRDERETVAADVLTSISGCVLSEAASSCITSSGKPVKGKRVRKCVKARSLKQPLMPDITQNIDNETCSDESCGEVDLTDWTDVEMAAFLHAISSYGKDFAMIAQFVRTKSQFQCKVLFSKTHKRIGLDLMGPRPENVGSLVNDDVDGGRSDPDNACIVESGSVNGSDTSGTKAGVDQPASDVYHDESNPVEPGHLSPDLDESEETNGKVDHEALNMVSNACVIGGESKLHTDGSNRSGSILDKRAIIMSDSTQIGKDEPSGSGGAVEFVSAVETIEPCNSNYLAEDRLVSDVSSGHRGNELEGPTIRDEADTDVVIERKDNTHDSNTSGNTSLSSLEVSCSRLCADAENEPQLCPEKPQFSGLIEVSLANAKSKSIEDAALQYKKSVSQFLLSCDYQANREMKCHSSSSNLGFQFCNPGNSLDHIDAARILQRYNLQVSSKKDVNVNMNQSSSPIELPLLPHKIEKRDGDRSKCLQSFSDSEEKPRDGDMKLFGKIITIPSSTQKSSISSKGCYENGTHHLKPSSVSSSLKLTSHDKAGEKSTLLKFVQDDFRGTENVPVVSHSNGDMKQPEKPGFSSLPDSSVLLAKYPAAFNSYPTPAKEDMQRINGFEAISSLQQQSKEIVEINGVGNPAILVGGSKSAASDLVPAIKMQHFDADQFVGQTGRAMKADESLGGGEDLGR